MIKEIGKILTESLKDNSGYSSKRLTTLVSFIVIVLMGFIDMITKYKINLAVFETFSAITLSYSGLSLYDKVKKIQLEKD